jgi:hypothetical protein
VLDEHLLKIIVCHAACSQDRANMLAIGHLQRSTCHQRMQWLSRDRPRVGGEDLPLSALEIEHDAFARLEVADPGAVGLDGDNIVPFWLVNCSITVPECLHMNNNNKAWVHW